MELIRMEFKDFSALSTFVLCGTSFVAGMYIPVYRGVLQWILTGIYVIGITFIFFSKRIKE